MIIVDTNVISELMRPAPEPRVDAWLAAQDDEDVYTTTISEAELLFGVALMPHGKRRDALTAAIERTIKKYFEECILPFDRPAAKIYATIRAQRQTAGRRIRSLDCQIAAIAQSVGADIATRNVAHFEECGVNIINPWRA